MFDKWFDSGVAKEFGIQMAMLLVQRSASEVERRARSKTVKNSERRFDITLHAIEKQLKKFTENHKLNIYSKAQMGSAFKFTLLENGFEPETANAMTTWILLRCK